MIRLAAKSLLLGMMLYIPNIAIDSDFFKANILLSIFVLLVAPILTAILLTKTRSEK